MQDHQDSRRPDGLERAVAEAVGAVLRRRGADQDLAEILHLLRRQLGKVLAEAPVSGDALDEIVLRARLASLFDAEITRHEAQVS
ncbi:MAG TPA: hypothetical protein VIL69_22160 [Roseomonas sp.]|jgi:hypothetical protein